MAVTQFAVAATCTLTRSLADADASSTMADEDLHLGIAGSSACRKADRLRQERERRKSERSPLGRAWAGVFPSVEDRKRLADERHWRTGAEGEQNLAALLAKRCPDVPMLHDRAVPRSRANIDHIAITLSGVYVIDCKRYKGKIEVASPLFGKPKLKIAGRDRTKLIDGLDKQVAHVKAALADIPEDVPIHGCLCFVAPEGFLADVGLPVLRTLKINGYRLYYPKRLAKRLNQDGPITVDQAQRLKEDLARCLPPAFP
ncbi:MAG: nuclease-related domain-containing protein [Solirubrobacterales bacterium]